MPRLIVTSTDFGFTIPLADGLEWDVIGSPRADVFEVGANATARILGGVGVDLIRLMGDIEDYTVKLAGSSAVFTHTTTADTVTLPMSTSGDQVQFGSTGTLLDLKILTGGGGATFSLGSQVLTADDAPITGVEDDVTVSLDGKGNASKAFVLDAAAGAFKFTDSAVTSNNVRINGYGPDDRIAIFDAVAADYAEAITTAPNGIDVVITYNNAGTVSQIVLTGITTAEVPVFSVASFNALSVGDLSFA